jgi:hypothetical protein
MNKKRRAFRRVAERTGNTEDLLFMKLSREVGSRLVQD